MQKYFEVKVRFNEPNDDGNLKATTSAYIIEALTFTEAEARAIQRMNELISSEYVIRTIKRCLVEEIFCADYNRFFLARVGFIAYNERTGKEKLTTTRILVGGDDYDDARNNFDEGMKGTVSDYVLQSLSETDIVAII